MNLDKFTERSRGFIQAAQTIATRENHQRLAPEHLLKALMDDEEGLAANLITRSGGDVATVRSVVNASVAKIPQVTGDAGQVYLDNNTAKVVDEAEKIAKKAGDSFVPVERLLMALAMVKSKAKDALDAGHEIVSASFIIPYPPGFPILVPGQVISQEILAFMLALDVSEIHGYRADLGLRVFTAEALASVPKIVKTITAAE